MPRALRLSLVHQAVLLLVAAVLLAVTALGGAVAWNLRSGFSDYLRLQDQAWLDRFTSLAAQAVAHQGLAALDGRSGRLRALLDAADGWGEPDPAMAAEGPPREGHEDEGPPNRRLPPRDERPPPPGERPPPPRHNDRPPRAATPRNGDRLVLLAADGRMLFGRGTWLGEAPLQRPIVVAGQTMAVAQLAGGVAAPLGLGALDANFLARQYRGILLTAAGLMLLAGASAVFIGRRWLRPVQAARQAAHRIALGHLDTRLTPQGSEELAGLASDINRMAASLQQGEASRRRWIAELSHEMRTPLAVLRGEVECLIDGVRPLGQPALLSLQAEVARLTRLVEDFHQLALSDLRALPCVFAPLDAAGLLREALARAAPRARAAGLLLDGDLPPGPLPAVWDAQRLHQLLGNLLENSLRYTQAPGRIRLQLQAGAGQATLTLDDSAPGVPEALQPRLFEPLFRVDASRSRQSGGSGLGLAICQALVRSHGGHIRAGTSPLGGLRVVLQLPLSARAPA